MKRYEFSLRLTAAQCLEYYRGAARQVVARADTGQAVQFPASLLQRFITDEGVMGRFALTCDDEFHHPQLQRIDTP